MPSRIVAVVTMGGTDRASESVVLSTHASMIAAIIQARRDRNCGRNAIAESAEDFVREGGSLPGFVRCLCGAVNPEMIDIGDGLSRCEHCGCH